MSCVELSLGESESSTAVGDLLLGCTGSPSSTEEEEEEEGDLCTGDLGSGPVRARLLEELAHHQYYSSVQFAVGYRELQARWKSDIAEPQTGSTQPHFGSSQPRLGSIQSHFGSNQPHFGSSQPQLGSSQPQLGSSQPQLGSSQPQLGSSQAHFGPIQHPDRDATCCRTDDQPGDHNSRRPSLVLDLPGVDLGGPSRSPQYGRGGGRWRGLLGSSSTGTSPLGTPSPLLTPSPSPSPLSGLTPQPSAAPSPCPSLHPSPRLARGRQGWRGRGKGSSQKACCCPAGGEEDSEGRRRNKPHDGGGDGGKDVQEEGEKLVDGRGNNNNSNRQGGRLLEALRHALHTLLRRQQQQQQYQHQQQQQQDSEQYLRDQVAVLEEELATYRQLSETKSKAADLLKHQLMEVLYEGVVNQVQQRQARQQLETEIMDLEFQLHHHRTSAALDLRTISTQLQRVATEKEVLERRLSPQPKKDRSRQATTTPSSPSSPSPQPNTRRLTTPERRAGVKAVWNRRKSF